MALKFAVVREDADLEATLVERAGARAALVVASGGCTALTLARRFPSLAVTAFDLSRAQLDHLAEKAAAAAAGRLAELNVDDPRPDGLNQRGEFEALFRVLRAYIEELVAPRAEIEALFATLPAGDAGADPPRALAARWLASRYWPAAFAVAFNDPLLHAMFGREATQHAPPGSYPGYFQRAFERGLLRDDAPRNPFLQHILLGRYLARDAPGYVRAGSAIAAPSVERVLGTLLDVPDLGRFDVISLSNIFDWSGDALVASWAAALAERARPGCAVLIRALNNDRDLGRFFGPRFRADRPLGAALLARDRSLFYSRVDVFVRCAP